MYLSLFVRVESRRSRDPGPHGQTNFPLGRLHRRTNIRALAVWTEIAMFVHCHFNINKFDISGMCYRPLHVEVPFRVIFEGLCPWRVRERSGLGLFFLPVLCINMLGHVWEEVPFSDTSCQRGSAIWGFGLTWRIVCFRDWDDWLKWTVISATCQQIL